MQRWKMRLNFIVCSGDLFKVWIVGRVKLTFAMGEASQIRRCYFQIADISYSPPYFEIQIYIADKSLG